VTALAVACSWRRPEPFARRVFDSGLSLRAVLSTYGFLDLGYTGDYLAHPRMNRLAKAVLLDAARSYLGRDIRGAVEAHPLASPLRILEAMGTECELHVAPGEMHGYDAPVWRPQARAKWLATHAFLDRHLREPVRNGSRERRALVAPA